jgi:hypothetical protein
MGDAIGGAPGDDRREIGAHILAGHGTCHDRVVQIADRGALLENVDDHGASRHRSRRDLLLVLAVRSNGRDEAARREIVDIEHGCARGRTCHHDVRVAGSGAVIVDDFDGHRKLAGQQLGQAPGGTLIAISQSDM